MGLYQSAFLEHRLDKASFQAEEPKLRAQLLEAQLALVERRDFPVLILVTGMDGAGKGGVIQRLYEWLDPRHLIASQGDREDPSRAVPGTASAGSSTRTNIIRSMPTAPNAATTRPRSGGSTSGSSGRNSMRCSAISTPASTSPSWLATSAR